jgi:UDP-N-acetylglucosamine--N-acetylmuramyl-(pentapeptide) pyrophosphoryl-undecaprenol N-acetylglucosamine transferase
MRIVIVGGGTGGHLYPGIAVAQELKRLDPSAAIMFIGSRGGGEREIVRREGFAFCEITASGLKRRKLQEQVVSLVHLVIGSLQALRVLRQVRPHVVLGLGSYVAGPVMLAAWGLRIPRVVQEQNVIPGVTNRVLGRIVDRVAVSFAQSLSYFPAGKAVLTGNPVRPALREVGSHPPEPNGRFHILVFGGSQGAHRLNMAMLEALPELADVTPALWVVHQTGRDDCAALQKAFSDAGFPGMVHSYIQDMADAYRSAHLVICRAGATTVAELTVTGKPSILVPFPYAVDDHQHRNARVLLEAGAARVLLDRELSGALLAEQIRYYLHHPGEVAQMAERSRALGKPDAAARVAELCFEVCRI